jgi:UDP-N-acetylglucosamine 4,6-dehydratase
MVEVRWKNVVLFGGSGFLASALIPRLMAEGAASILCVARNEGNLIKTQQEFGVEILSGNIADSWIAAQAMRDREIVMNLSAFKHVGLAETSTFQCLKSNVVGLMTLLSESLRRQPEAFVFISTDKAAAPVRGVYGASKFLGERLVREAEKINPETAYRVVRYGNILYSTSSVLCKWRDSLDRGQKLIITDPEATRFYWTVGQAVDLIFECLTTATDCSPCVADMKAIRMGDLLAAVIQKYGNGKKIEVETIGLQPGESQHEIIVESGPDSYQTEKYTPKEVLALI